MRQPPRAVPCRDDGRSEGSPRGVRARNKARHYGENSKWIPAIVVAQADYRGGGVVARYVVAWGHYPEQELFVPLTAMRHPNAATHLEFHSKTDGAKVLCSVRHGQ